MELRLAKPVAGRKYFHLLVEIHPEPDRALSDMAKSLDFARFENLRDSLRRLAEPLGKTIN
jgi:3-deoxy-7-phosphoheptulonate synthase